VLTKVTITDSQKLVLPYGWQPNKMPLLEREFEFNSGLNIMLGTNGCGKSTLLRTLAELHRSGQTQIPKETTGYSAQYSGIPESIRVEHDGELVFYLNQDERPGLIDGMAALDDENISAVMTTLGYRTRSRGEQSMAFLVTLFDRMAQLPVGSRIHATKQHEDYLKGNVTLEQKKQTLLLDEPDTSITFSLSSRFWGYIKEKSAQYQIIAATHNPVALAYADHVIEITENAERNMRADVAKLAKFLA